MVGKPAWRCSLSELSAICNAGNSFGLYCGLENARMNLYERKSSGLIGLLALLYYDNVSENWGLMEEDGKSNKILIAADIEGLNMPLRLHIDKKLVKQFIKDYENATIITNDIKEFKNVEEEENDNKFKIFTQKNFLKYYFGAIIIIGILIIIGIKFAS